MAEGSTSIKNAVRRGVSVVTVQMHGREFSFVNRCSHLPNCDLSRGRVEGSTLFCICGWQYDLLTGRAVNHPLARLEIIEPEES